MDKVSRWFSEVMSRSILASAYCISALFSPVFLKVKERLKDTMQQGVVYVDGMTPQQMEAHASTFGDAEWIVTDDLSKQDAATKWLILNTEYLIYEGLGVDPGALNLYFWIHSNWRWKGRGMSGIWDAMRLTGQPTTAIGNAITNLIVHNRFYARNRLWIKLMAVLGDDNVLYATKQLNVKRHGTETKEIYNIQSKVEQRRRVGDFLGMLVHTLDNKINVCPNIARMRENFSVSNYTHTVLEREEKIEQRVLSYCFMLGKAPNIKSIANTINDNINLPDWYDWDMCVTANEMFYNISREQVLNCYSSLLHLLSHRTPIEATQLHWSSDLNIKGGLSRLLERRDAKIVSNAQRTVLED